VRSPINKLREVGQRGQSMVEYALLLVLVSVVVVAVLTALGAEIKTVFTHVIQALGG
jgi:Flp pilus assembly pilin Flp